MITNQINGNTWPEMRRNITEMLELADAKNIGSESEIVTLLIGSISALTMWVDECVTELQKQ